MSPLWLKHMYSVLSALTWRTMPATARSRPCSKVSAWAGVFARSVLLSAWSASVIVCAEYLLLLSFASLKPFYFIKSIDVLSTYSRQIINRYGANVSPCSTPATMLKLSVSPSDKRTFTFIIMAATVSLGRRRLVIFAPSSRCVWIQMPWRSRRIIVLSRGFCTNTFKNGLSKFVMSRIDFSKSHFASS